MELQEFREETLQTVGLSARANLEFNSVEYAKIVANDLIEFEECTDYNPLYYEGLDKKGRKIEIYGYVHDEDDNTLSIFSCAYSGKDEMEVLTKVDVMRLFERAKAFVLASFDGVIQAGADESNEAYELSAFLSSKREEIERYRFYIISDCEKSDRMKTLEVEPIDGKPTVISLWDISNYFDLKVSKLGYDDTVITFSDFNSPGIPCLKASEEVAGSRYDAYLCVMPGHLLAQLFDKYGGRLLEANVRSFLRLTTKTNKGIRATMLKEPHMFFAYNNGITTTATGVMVEDRPEGKAITGITCLQIVNGGQTTATISTVTKSKDSVDIDSIYVPMKISVIPKKDAEEIVPKISRCANTQNKISEADFFSNHPFHRLMDSYSHKTRVSPQNGETYTTRWFYERARGQYMQEQAGLSMADKKKFLLENPKDKFFTKTDLAKFRNSYEKHPEIVSRGAQASFMEYARKISEVWIANEAVFNEEYFKESVALAIIFRETEKLVTNQPWYNGGYRANIVTYTVAKLSDMVDEMGGKLDLMMIWDDQSLSEVLRQQIVLIAKYVSESITAPNPVVQNVTQWCKRPACWERVKALHIEPLPGITKCLISEGRQKYRQRAAATTRRTTSNINARIQVVNAGSEYWKNICQWGIDHDLLNPDERSFLKSAFNMDRENGGRLPSEAQSSVIIKIRDRLREDGFKG
jgi:hypothetical protein